MVKVNITVKKEFTLADKSKQFKTELLNLVANDGVLTMESITPRRTSRGANSYKKFNTGENTREIRNNAFYLPYVNDGTGLYGPKHKRITPVHANYLHFFWHGREWFVKSVKGQQPKKFVERGTKNIASSVEKLTVTAARRTLG